MLTVHFQNKVVDTVVIQDALGHSKSSTTEKYLRALDDEAIDPEMDKLYGA